MTTQKKAIPAFSNEQEEREFWATHDSTEYVEWDKATSALFAELKATTISDAQPPRRDV